MTPPLSLVEVLEAEHAQLRGASADSEPAPESQDAAARLQRHYRIRHRASYAAVCLSGGGIRSAIFALGVMQGLAKKGLLTSFDYLSTVSGGGFTGGWLASWLHRAGPDLVSAQLVGDRLARGDAEAPPVRRMRMYSRYMSPQAGFFSPDGWTLGATILRNLLLNWIVLVPLIAAALLGPRVYKELIDAVYRPAGTSETLELWEPSTIILAVSVALILRAIVFATMNLPGCGNRRGSQRDFLVRCHGPACAGIIGLTLFWSMEDVGIVRWMWLIVLANMALSASAFAAGSLLSNGTKWRPRTWLAGAAAGATISLVLLGVMTAFPKADGNYAVLAFPLVLLGFFATIVVLVGIGSEELGDADLEWYSRLGAWNLMTALAWLGGSALVLNVPGGINHLFSKVTQLRTAAPILIPALGVLVRLLMANPSGRLASWRRVGLAAAGPTFALLLLSFIAWANDALLRSLYANAPDTRAYLGATLLPEAIVLEGGLLLIVLGMGRFVRANKFSLHGMYRERLIRAFLGASRSADERCPNPFTGFDPEDDLKMWQLRSVSRPMLVVNMTLNKLARARLVDLQRKAESFTATPLHVGTPSLGYRPAAEYASHGDPGISLGNAMTISGAAASSNMGMYSSPALTFLLTLFNARLGAWLGNPASPDDTWRKSDPKHGLSPLLDEMLGRTTDDSAYVYLSDGGHFENLGIWQMIQRRCRYILVSDASCDDDYAFDDLGNAIRQVRIDFGVPIVFERGCRMDREHQGNGNPHYAVARILYSAVDGPEAEDGFLVYVKATLCGGEPIDVLNYSRANPSFPHESTAQQWFSEAQFESYRILGFHAVQEMADGYRGSGGVGDFFQWLERRSLDQVRPVPETTPDIAAV